MELNEKRFNLNNIWGYVLFLFAFICCGFTYNSMKVEAAPVISLPSDDDFNYDRGLTFYVGYDTWTVNALRYSFDDGNSWTVVEKPNENYVAIYANSKAEKLCNSIGYIKTCTGMIIEYKIDKANLPNSKSNGVNDNGKFNFKVDASNRVALVLGGESSESVELTYDGVAPSIKKVVISRSSIYNTNIFGIGHVINFSVHLSELSDIVYTGEIDLYISFKIGNGSKKALCVTNTKTSVDMFRCTYKVNADDKGNINSLNLVGADSHVKDKYNNFMNNEISVDVENLEFDKKITNEVDGVKPTINSIMAEEGVYTSDNNIKVTVEFSEKLVATTNAVMPTLKVKFGVAGSDRICAFSSGYGASLLYLCKGELTDQGDMAFVSLTGGSLITDTALNELNLSSVNGKTLYLSNASVNNNLPTIAGSPVVSGKDCKTNGDGVTYCKKDSEIKISITFNMDVDYSSASKDLKLSFGGVNAKNSFSSFYDSTNRKLVLEYSVNALDNGKMSLKYSFTIQGINGKENTIGSSSEFDYYVDNSSPSVSDFKIYFNEEEVKENVIYGTPASEISFYIDIVDDSAISSFDSSRVYLVDGNGNRISTCGICDIVNLESALDNKRIITTIKSADRNLIASFKVKVEAGAIKDFFGRTLSEDYTSDTITINSKNPSFEVEVNYPEYKGYNDGNKWLLISGNSIDFNITSDDSDLKDFCIISSDSEVCEQYTSLDLTKEYSYSFNATTNGNYSFYVRVRDNANNINDVFVSFEYKNMFSYSNGINTISKNHSITVDVSMIDTGVRFKYAWFKKGSSINFDNANVTSKQDDFIVLEGSGTYNGEYNVCINNLDNDTVLCSGYVKFDTIVDKFTVNISEEPTNGDLVANLEFNDISAIKCIAIGKGVSNINCETTNNPNVIIYKTSQAISPFNKYVINENNHYYFYIEDSVGNSSSISKSVTNIDKEAIVIEVFNANGEYNTNLEIDTYKNNHKFLIVFDRDRLVGSAHSLYKYFFSTEGYTVNNRDDFESYYINNINRGEVTSVSNKSMTVSAPSSNGIYNLYIMAIDRANNVTIKDVLGIKVDVVGPNITMYDSNNEETNGGSADYIIAFDYSVVIEDYDSRLDLNNIYYKWIEDGINDVVISKKYDSCPFDYNTCKIEGKNIEFSSDLFDPSRWYKFVVEAYDNANNSKVFTSNNFRIDTTSPIINIDVEDKWYTSNEFSFSVSKENNVGTLNRVGYCLNDCLSEEEYDLTKFSFLTVTNRTIDTKIINLVLNEGINTIYVYAIDVFGNYKYESSVIKYDTNGASIVINNLNENNVIDLSEGDKVIDLTISDSVSGVKEYYIYKDGNDKGNVISGSLLSQKYVVSENGRYFIEVIDNALNSVVYSVNVIGIDTEPVMFDLVSSVQDGKFTNEDVIISVTNMRKAMVNDVSDRVSKIDYIVLDYDVIISDYASTFTSGVISIYDRSVNTTLVTSFSVSENKLYVVRVIDTAGNISYNYIKINNIDRDDPFVNTNKYSDGKDRIVVTTSSGNNVRIDASDTIVYKYSNEVIRIVFGDDSLRDLSTGFNNYLGLKVCFEVDGECVYNTYSVTNRVSDLYLINNVINIEAPYNFSGIIRYYIVDGAGNESDKYAFNVEYVSEVSEINVVLSDDSGNSIVNENKYNSIKALFSGEEISEIITNGGVKYTLVDSKVNLLNEFLNRSNTINAFLNSYSFVNVSEVEVDISKSNVDENYYVWVYVQDLLNNYKLFKVDSLVRIDTIAPLFSEVNLSIDKIDSSNYDLMMDTKGKNYTLEIDVNNNGEYESVNFEDNVYSFAVRGISTISLRLVDEANNVTTSSFNLNVTSSTYVRAYQKGNERKVNIVTYNLGSNEVSAVRYIVTTLNSSELFDDNSINDDSIPTCSGYETTCKRENASLVSKGIYEISLSEDKRVIVYVYVNGVLVKDNNGELAQINVLVDTINPIITFDGNNPSAISTVNGSYSFGVKVSDNNLSNLNNIKYIFTSVSNISRNTFNDSYNSCVSSNGCVRGVYDLDSEYNGVIDVNSNISGFSSLSSGNYYIYTYVSDDFSNSSMNRSSLIYVDNTVPVISYSIKNSLGVYQTYTEINGEVFVGSAVKMRFVDNRDMKYFKIYSNDEISAVCYVGSTVSDVNCVKNSSGEIGYVSENTNIFYYLDSGNYRVVAYDAFDNVKEVYINVDNSNPVIELFKNVSGNYEPQLSERKLYNSLNGLYLKVSDSNFSYLTIDLVRSSGEVINTAVRYSYNSVVGECLLGVSSGCDYGSKLVDLLADSTISYNKIVVNVFDKANRTSKMEINYDDIAPYIWTMNDGENIYIDGVLYSIKANMSLDFEIGVNNLTLDKVLGKIILDVDGKSYESIKGNELFKVSVYRDDSEFREEVFNNIGAYRIEVNYADEAGNIASKKTINISILDNTSPELIVLDTTNMVEVNEEVTLLGVKASDNYGFEVEDGTLIKEKIISYSSCSAVIDGTISGCSSIVSKVSENVYKFTKIGTYTFTYTISDLSSNSSTISQVIYVNDTYGPVMSSVHSSNKFELEFGTRGAGEQLNIDNITFMYPTSYDNGDSSNKSVTYEGLFSINNMGEKYKLSDDYYIISNNGSALVYKFTKIGTYYLVFTSSDNYGNESSFEYEVIVSDKIAPIIDGVNNDAVIEISLEDVFSVEDTIINYYNVKARDNYDENVKVYYEVKEGSNHTYEVVLRSEDSSNNKSSKVVYVDIVDHIPPVSGELVLPESTNLNSVEFSIVGGSDNSNNYHHEYNIQSGAWIAYNSDSKLLFGDGLSNSVRICVRAIDASGNVSINGTCKDILVDTKKPEITGIKDGDIVSSEVNVNVSDDRLDSVQVWYNNELMSLDMNGLPFTFNEVGAYSVEAKDTLGNITKISFIINVNVFMDVVNDLNAEEYTVTSVDFDKRLLVKADIEYDNNGDSNIVVDLSNISVNDNDMIYILGVVPETSNTFVMFSVSGYNVKNYSDGIKLIGDGNQFKEGINNEDCFLSLNEDYYAYVIVKENVSANPVVNDEESISNAGRDDSEVLSIVLIVFGSLAALLIGYQIIKFRKRVRAA